MEQYDLLIKIKLEAVDKKTKTAFVSCFLIGIICHLFIMVGLYPDFSGLNLFVNNAHVQLVEGRWISAILMSLDGIVTLPVIIGVFMLLFLAVGGVILTKIFELESITSIILFCGLYVTFPVIASKNNFFYMSECYALADCMAIAAVWYWKKSDSLKDICACAACLTVSIACYQSDLSVALLLFIYLSVFRIISGDPLKQIMCELLRAAICCIVALSIWYIIFKITLYKFNLWSYRDLKMTLHTVLRGIKQTYATELWFMTKTFYSLNFGRLLVAFLVGSLCFFLILAIVRIYYINEPDLIHFMRILFIIVIIFLYPVFANYTYIVVPSEPMKERLLFSHFLIPCTPILLCEKVLVRKQTARYSNNAINVQHLYKKVTGIVSACAILFFIVVSNTGYMNLHLRYERDYSLAIRMIDRIESTPGYHLGMDVFIIQNQGYSTYDGTTDDILEEFIPNMEFSGYALMGSPDGILQFMKEFIHTRVHIRDGGINTELGLEAWPSLNCIVIQDERMYFRLT